MIKPNGFFDILPIQENISDNQKWRLKLDENENVYECSNCIISAIKNLSSSQINLFSKQDDLVKKVAEKFSLSENNIIFTNQKEDSIRSIMDVYLDCGDEIVSYNKFDDFLHIQAKIKKINLKYVDYHKKFIFNKEDFESSLSQNTKMAYISIIDEITGSCVRTSVLEILIQKHPEILFVVDCSYIAFSEILSFQDYIDLTKKYNNVILIKSYAHDYAIAGLGLNIIISNCVNIANIKRLVSYSCVNIVSLSCALMLVNDDKNIENIKELNKNAKDYMFQELEKLNFKPYESEANFLLCDFGNYCDFYYEKLKKHGVITKKFSKNSELRSFLRITVPTIGGVKYIIELLNKKDLLIFNVDGVIFDVTKSYIEAIRQTFKYFTYKTISIEEVLEVKNLGEMNSAWKIVRCLLEHYGYQIEMDKIIQIFQNLFYNSKDKSKKYLIDNDELLIPREIIQKLAIKYDLVVFSERFRDEIKYSFEKNQIDDYFYYYVTSDDLPKNMLKPNPTGVYNIIKCCPHKDIKYIGSSVDDIIAGNSAEIETIGVIIKDSENNSLMNNFRHLGASYILPDINYLYEYLEDIK